LNLLLAPLLRAAQLLGLAIAPPLLAPEPRPSDSPLAALLALLALGAITAAALRARSRIQTREATIAAILIVASVIISVICGAYFQGPRAPLGRGLLLVAIPLWAGLALMAGEAAALRGPKEDAKRRRVPAFLGTIAVSIALLAASSGWLFAKQKMWWTTVLREGNVPRALDELIGQTPVGGDASAALSILDACVIAKPESCDCLARRAEVKLKTHDNPSAMVDARSATGRCPNHPAAIAALVTTLVAVNDAAEAERLARQALTTNDDAKLHYALALALDQQGRPAEALAEARRAIELGAGRDAHLAAGAIAIRENDLETATKVLTPLVANDPKDAEAAYDLALVADKKNDYNHAREGYLAALRADPKLAIARYNLALLTLRNGVLEEAGHHAKKFVELMPNDPRGAELVRRIDAARANVKKP